MDTVVRLKNNNVESIKSIKKEVNKSDKVAAWTDVKGYDSVKVYDGNFNMKNVEKPLRFVKFLMEKLNGNRSQMMIVTTCMGDGFEIVV